MSGDIRRWLRDLRPARRPAPPPPAPAPAPAPTAEVSGIFDDDDEEKDDGPGEITPAAVDRISTDKEAPEISGRAEERNYVMELVRAVAREYSVRLSPDRRTVGVSDPHEVCANAVAPTGPRETARQLFSSDPRESPARPGFVIRSPPCANAANNCCWAARLELEGAGDARPTLMAYMSHDDLVAHERTGEPPARVGGCWVCVVSTLLLFVTRTAFSDFPVPEECLFAPVVARLEGGPPGEDTYRRDDCWTPAGKLPVGLGTPFPIPKVSLLRWQRSRDGGWQLNNSGYFAPAAGPAAGGANHFFC